MELGKKIRQYRLKAGLTQEQLAEKLYIAPQSVSKWENSVAMPDISSLPLLAEIFGVTIDDMFDLTVEQRLNRIEHRMDIEDNLPQDVFLEYEEFLKTLLSDPDYRKRATELIAYLYWHRMETYARKAGSFARAAVRLSPGEKGCQWVLNKAAGHAAWDWNISNHTEAADFYRELAESNPKLRLPYMYLIDNLIADRRADEAEKYLDRLCALEDSNPVMNQVYRAHIALARFDEKTADAIIEELVKDRPDDSACLFEAAQYYAGKSDYGTAIKYYELSFEKDTCKPRFQDALQAIADIYRITGRYEKAAETCDRILDLLQNEWGITEGDELKNVQNKKARLIDMARGG